MQVIIKNHKQHIPLPKRIHTGDWIDLRAAETVKIKAMHSYMISLGVAMQLPVGYEAHILPRSSTFNKWGILMVNGMGIIDNSYCGDSDIWCFQALAMRDTEIKEGDRICQFRILHKQSNFEFKEVEFLSGTPRGGFGSTGTN